MNKMREPSNWISHTKRVDVDTGEEITTQNAKTNYIKIKTIKHVRKSKFTTGGYIEYITEYRRNPQTRLTFNNT